MKVSPFNISPNPNCLYISPSIKTTIHKIRFACESGLGLSALLGDLGLGKSALCRYLFSEFSSREDMVCTLIASPQYSSLFAMARSIALDFGLDTKRSLQAQQDVLQEYFLNLFKQGKTAVIIFDEAQMLTSPQLELLRGVFLNFEHNERKLVQIVLSAQLELRDRLILEKNKPLYSRIATYSILEPFSNDDLAGMIEHRANYYSIKNPFTEEGLMKLWEISSGVPRNALKVAALAYEMMQMAGLKQIPVEFIQDAVSEVAI